MAEYGKNWDSYYRRTYRLLKSKSLWEVSPSAAVEIDRERFKSHLTTDLPIIDIGCGTGEQTIHLKKHYPNVLGVDVAQEAIKIAKQRYQDIDVSFDTFNIADTIAARKIAQKMGPSHVYIRGVLHQTLEEDRADILEALQILLGSNGKLYIIEVADNIRTHLQEQVPSFSDLPDSMRRALMSNLPPKGLSQESLITWFPTNRFTIEESGDSFLATNLLLPDGSILKIPAVYAIIKSLS